MTLRSWLDAGLLFCPACRGIYEGAYREAPLALDEVWAEAAGRVLHGQLACSGCAARYPVVDGTPLVAADLPALIARERVGVFWREDLPTPLRERLVSAAFPEDQDAAWRRTMVAIYSEGLEATREDDPSPVATAVREAADRTRAYYAERLGALLGPLEAPWIVDLGCGVGEQALVAARLDAHVLALDASVPPLRLLARLLREGQAEVPSWRHGGNDYVSRTVAIPAEGRDRVTPLCGDALSPPLGAASLDAVTCFNLLDNVSNPAVLLQQIHGALKPGGVLALSTPYAWAEACTPPPARLGETIRAGDDPDPAAALVALLQGELPAVAPGVRFEVTLDRRDVPWALRRNRRSTHLFHCHYVEARKLHP